MTATGRLVLVSTPIGNLGDLSPRAVETLRSCALICCEDTRHSGKLLSHAGVSGVRLAIANEHTELARLDEVLGLLAAGSDVAVVTDAGTPGISDPGARLVRAAVEAGYVVSAVPGPAALVMALVISGFDSTRFVFEGFLPRRDGQRRQRLRSLASEPRTIVFFESPRRLQSCLADMVEFFGPDRPVAVCRELTKTYEEVLRGTIGEIVERVEGILGEVTVVVAGAPEVVVAPADLVAEVAERVGAGMRRSEAVAAVAKEFGVSRRELYALVVAPSGEA